MTAEEEFKRWLLAYYIRHGHYFSKDELRECWLAATKATATRCVEICRARQRGQDFILESAARAIEEEFGIELNPGIQP